jgi:ATP-dependent helicase/nuclease subunit A
MIAARKKPPVDHEARTRAATDLVTSIALSAGAGSGKTSVLTARIVGLLESGVVAPGALAAMTFTEKAAGEILARVRDALEARLREATAPARRRTLEDVLARFGDLEADFAPGTDVGDEAQARTLLDTAIAAWLETLRAERPQHWRLIERLVSQNALALACQALDRYRDLEDVILDAPLDPTIAVAELDGLVHELADAAGACSDEEDGLFLKLQPVLQAAQQATARRDAEAVCDLLLDGEPLKLGRAGVAGKWGGAKGKERAIEAALAIDGWKARWRAHAHADVVRSLRAGLLPAYDELRQRAGVASFDDLLRLAARLLRTRPEARERLAQRFQVLLVDEVQDTDPVQAEVATLLSRALHDAGPWHESQALPGKLFVVGDPKQSIYRFRGADVGTFARSTRAELPLRARHRVLGEPHLRDPRRVLAAGRAPRRHRARSRGAAAGDGRGRRDRGCRAPPARAPRPARDARRSRQRRAAPHRAARRDVPPAGVEPRGRHRRSTAAERHRQRRGGRRHVLLAR